MRIYIHINNTPIDDWWELQNNRDLMSYIKENHIKKFDYRQGFSFDHKWIEEIRNISKTNKAVKVKL